MSIFSKVGFNNACIFQNVDTAIHQEQCKLIAAELNDLGAKTQDRWEKMLYRYWESVEPGYSSFVFVFDDDVLELSDSEQVRINDTLEEFLNGSDWLQSYMTMKSCEERALDASKDELEEENSIISYVDACIECGYKISIKDLTVTFKNQYTQEEIEKKILFKKIKNPESFEP